MRIQAIYPIALLPLLCQSLPAHEPHDAIDVVAVSPNYAQDQTVIAAFDNFTLNAGVYGILKSTDGGITWSAIQGLPNNTATSALVFSPAYGQDQTIFIAGPGGLWASTNQGASWSVLMGGAVNSVAVSPNFANDKTLFVAGDSSVSESTDGGQTWTTLAPPPALASKISIISISPNFVSDRTLLLGTGFNGIYESSDAGSSWVQVTAKLGEIRAIVFSLNFAADHTVYAGAYGSGILVSTTAAKSWGLSNTGLTDRNVTALALSSSYTQDSTIYAATAGSGVFVSNTLGKSWTLGSIVPRQLSPQSPSHYRSLVAAPAASGTLLYLAMWEGLWTSTNGALSWQYINTIPSRMIRHINISPAYAQDQTVYVSSYGSGNLWSTDGGVTWTIQNTGMHVPYTDASAMSPNFAQDMTAFNGTHAGLEKTANGGVSWVLSQGGFNAPIYIRAIGVSPNYAQDATLLLGTRNGPASCPSGVPMVHGGSSLATYTGLFLSTDGGATWGSTSLTRPVSAGCWGVLSAAMSPAFANDHTAFAASPDTGLYKSTDGGVNWTQLTLSTTAVAIVITSPGYANDQTVFAGGYYRGIFKSSDGGSTWTVLPQTENVRALDIRVSPDYASDQTLYAATIQMGLVQFTNGGSTVTPVTSFPDTFVSAVGLSPDFAGDSTIFAAGYHGLYKSIDGGVTWTYTNEPARVEDSSNVAGPGQAPPDIVFQGSWTAAASPPSSTNSVMRTSSSGDTASFSFYGVGVDWLSYTGPGQGSASIVLDGAPQGTVSLNAPVSQYQQVVWKAQGLLCGLHTVTVTALPGTGQSVSLDAFDVSISSCEPGASPRRH